MAIDRELIRKVRALDEYDLRRLLIFVKGVLVSKSVDAPQSESVGATPGKVSYRLESVSCGKPGCSRCPHGPYWYAYWREGGKLRSQYIGRRLPPSRRLEK